jgi:sporulation protein YlmC with PRC-barrel domain
MNAKVKRVSTGWLLIAILPFLAGAAVLDEPIQHDEQAQQVAQSADYTPSLERANELIGARVINDRQERLGRIEDILLTPNRNAVSYAVLAHGGFLGFGGKFFAVPWTEFEIRDDENILVLPNVSPADLREAPGFDRDNWPTTADRYWLRRYVRGELTPDQPGDIPPPHGEGALDVREYREHPELAPVETIEPPTAMVPEAREDIRYRRVSGLTGTSVQNLQGETLGDLDDLVIDMHEGHVAYGVLSMRRGFLGLSRELAVVPWSAIDVLSEPGAARLDMDRETLQAMAFRPADFPNLADPQYSREIHQRFGATPYWEVFGFVADPDQMDSAVSPWTQGSAYHALYDPDTVRMIHGTVESLGTFRLEGTAIEGVFLRIRTDEGEAVTVHAGPLPYLERQEITFRYGDRIMVTGSPAELGRRDIFIASQIRKVDHTLDLRDEQGRPQWRIEDLQESR